MGRLSNRLAKVEAKGGSDVADLKAKFDALKKDVDELRSTKIDFTMMDPFLKEWTYEHPPPLVAHPEVQVLIKGTDESLDEEEDAETEDEDHTKEHVLEDAESLQDLEDNFMATAMDKSQTKSIIIGTSGIETNLEAPPTPVLSHESLLAPADPASAQIDITTNIPPWQALRKFIDELGHKFEDSILRSHDWLCGRRLIAE
ncbi:hypothetical protein HAX54_015416 [Datura stramonium]|uniref:Uncharacterized protein n=1 Tax=Datura stramonium TaxID=4076 RepID=A0ABS8TRS4_DATST|nr:hypothetical protein [Datura stramonium]